LPDSSVAITIWSPVSAQWFSGLKLMLPIMPG
jgi:hypothetical protein